MFILVLNFHFHFQAFFGVYDGHGGAKVAEIAAKRMSENVIDQVTRRTDSELEEAIKDGYLATDREVSEEGVSGGACCVAALIRNGNLAVSNVGDCRAVLSRRGKAEALTSDHRPCREDERNRIENLVRIGSSCWWIKLMESSFLICVLCMCRAVT